jgi:single-strand DNA-binding protein
MKTLNRVQLLGYLGNDPQVKENDKAIVATFSIATTERNAEGEEVAEWHRVVAFGKLAEICRDHLKKGQPVFVEGRLKKSVWEEEGARKHKTEVISDEVIFWGNREAASSEMPQDVADENLPSEENPPSGDKPTPKETEEPAASERQVAMIRKLAGQKGYKVAEIEKMVSEAKSRSLASKVIERLTKEKR